MPPFNATKTAFIADDFGMSPDVNGAIAEAHRAGALHGASLMVDQRHTAEAVGMAREFGGELPVGLHLNFSDKRDIGAKWKAFPWRMGFPVTHREARRSEFAERFVAETRMQFEAFRATELPLAFVNGHHHVHIQPVIFNEIRESLRDLFPTFDGWIRLGEARFFRYPAWPLSMISRQLMTRDPEWSGDRTTQVWGSMPAFYTRANDVVRTVAGLGDGFHEFYFHPGDDKPRGTNPELGDDGQKRKTDLDALLDPNVVALAQAARP